jgi:hypothetical protein
MFSKRTRIWLAIIGLVMIIISLSILAFALRSPEHVRTQMTLIPTLLTPPAGVP